MGGSPKDAPGIKTSTRHPCPNFLNEQYKEHDKMEQTEKEEERWPSQHLVLRSLVPCSSAPQKSNCPAAQEVMVSYMSLV